jgi:plasmid stability protein
MAVMTIRDLDDEVRDKLRIRAAQNKRSMEAEVRAILTAAVESPVERTFVDLLMELREAGRDSNFEVPSSMRQEWARDPFA